VPSLILELYHDHSRFTTPFELFEISAWWFLNNAYQGVNDGFAESTPKVVRVSREFYSSTMNLTGPGTIGLRAQMGCKYDHITPNNSDNKNTMTGPFTGHWIPPSTTSSIL
jgi:hypothetical protein